MAQKILGLDLGAASIKAALISSTFRGFELIHSLEHALPIDPDVPWTERLRRALSEMRADKLLAADVHVVAAPGHLVSTHVLEVPFKDRKRIDPMIGFEIESVVPFDLDDIVYDYEVLAKSDGGPGADVHVAVIRRDDLKELLDVLSTVGVDPRVIELDSVCYLNLAARPASEGAKGDAVKGALAGAPRGLGARDAANDAGGPDDATAIGAAAPVKPLPASIAETTHSEGAVAIIDIGHERTNICIIDEVDGLLAAPLGRTIYGGGQDIVHSVMRHYEVPLVTALEMLGWREPVVEPAATGAGTPPAGDEAVPGGDAEDAPLAGAGAAAAMSGVSTAHAGGPVLGADEATGLGPAPTPWRADGPSFGGGEPVEPMSPVGGASGGPTAVGPLPSLADALEPESGEPTAPRVVADLAGLSLTDEEITDSGLLARAAATREQRAREDVPPRPEESSTPRRAGSTLPSMPVAGALAGGGIAGRRPGDAAAGGLDPDAPPRTDAGAPPPLPPRTPGATLRDLAALTPGAESREPGTDPHLVRPAAATLRNLPAVGAAGLDRPVTGSGYPGGEQPLSHDTIEAMVREAIADSAPLTAPRAPELAAPHFPAPSASEDGNDSEVFDAPTAAIDQPVEVSSPAPAAAARRAPRVHVDGAGPVGSASDAGEAPASSDTAAPNADWFDAEERTDAGRGGASVAPYDSHASAPHELPLSAVPASAHAGPPGAASAAAGAELVETYDGAPETGTQWGAVPPVRWQGAGAGGDAASSIDAALSPEGGEPRDPTAAGGAPLRILREEELAALVREACTPLARSIYQTFHAYRARRGRPVTRLYLCGGATRVPGLVEELGRRLPVALESLDGLRGAEELHRNPALAKALGLALREVPGRTGTTKFNLRRGPFAFKGGLQFVRDRVPRLTAAAAAIFLLLGLNTWVQFHLLDRVEAQLDERLRTFTQKILGVTIGEFTVASLEIQRRMKPEANPLPRFSAVDILNEIGRRKPPGVDVDIQELDIQPNKVRLKGETSGYDAMENFVKSLEGYGCFKDVKPGKSKNVKRPGTEVERVEFPLSITIDPSGC